MIPITKLIHLRTLSLSLCGLCAILGTQTMHAQDEIAYRMEIGGGLGMSTYWGDLNTNAFSNQNFSGTAIVRFLLNPRMAIKTSLGHHTLSGSTKDLKTVYPTDSEIGTQGAAPLEYKFQTSLWDLSAMYELNFWPYGFQRGYQGYRRLTPYMQFGVGLSYIPQYSALTTVLPLGVGVKYKIGARLNIALDWIWHFTMSDKLDGLSAPYGIKSSGFKNKDHYVSTWITLTYDIAPRCITCNKD